MKKVFLAVCLISSVVLASDSINSKQLLEHAKKVYIKYKNDRSTLEKYGTPYDICLLGQYNLGIFNTIMELDSDVLKSKPSIMPTDFGFKSKEEFLNIFPESCYKSN